MIDRNHVAQTRRHIALLESIASKKPSFISMDAVREKIRELSASQPSAAQLHRDSVERKREAVRGMIDGV